MIALSRDRAAMPAGFVGARKKKREQKLLLEYRDVLLGKKPKLEWDSAYWGAAKEQLIVESAQKCAYCETNFKTVSFGDVEHFRPKSVYWWLAYCLENYLASCQICNQAMKRDAFPLPPAARAMSAPKITARTTDKKLEGLNVYPDAGDTKSVKTFAEAHYQERALLLNPYLDNPSEFLVWRVDDTLKEVEILPVPNKARASSHISAMNEFYGLNRIELKQKRYKVFLALRVAKKSLESADISLHPDAQALWDSLHEKGQDYLGMIQYFDVIGLS